jgi:hypothetical protein
MRPPLNTHNKTSFDADGVPRCPIGLRMHPSFLDTYAYEYQAQRYRCPLLYPEKTGCSCGSLNRERFFLCSKHIPFCLRNKSRPLIFSVDVHADEHFFITMHVSSQTPEIFIDIPLFRRQIHYACSRTLLRENYQGKANDHGS